MPGTVLLVRAAAGDDGRRGPGADRARVDEDGAVADRAGRRHRQRALGRASATGSSRGQPLVARGGGRRERRPRPRPSRPARRVRDANATAHAELIADLRARGSTRVRGGGGERARERHVSRGKLPAARARRPPARPRLARSSSSRRWPPRSMYDGAAPGAGIVTGDRPASSGRECVVVANDATVKGGTYYPMTRQEAPARAGDRARRTACPASTWSTPAAPSCRCRTRSSPTASTSAGSSTTRPPVGARDPADRRGDGLLHRRRRLRAGDERRDRDRPRPGHDLPRRPAAGEGGHRRGGQRRGARRRRRARPHLRRRRPPRRRRRARAARSSARSSPTLPAPRRPPPWERREARAAGRSTPTTCSASSRSTRARPTTRAR